MFSNQVNLSKFINPSDPEAGNLTISTDILYQARELSLVFQIEGNTDSILWPEPVQEANRADELWQHTCFEAFLQATHSPGYLEFNFSPDRRWNCYRFDSYRQGMAAANPAPNCLAIPPEVSANRRRYEFRIDLDDWLASHDNPPCRLGISSVIEHTDGRIEYWAIKHRADKPDFHDQETFVCDLPSP